MDITADQIFNAGNCAPRGTYLCLQTGIVHRLSRPTTLPRGGPFRMVAPTEAIGAIQPGALTRRAPAATEFRWPKDETAMSVERGPGIFAMMAAYRMCRAGQWW